MNSRVDSKFQVFLLMLLLAAVPISAQEARVNLSLVSLIANPEKYDGKNIRVTGFLHVQFEDSALYFHKDDADHLLGSNALWIAYGKEPRLEPLCGEKFKNTKLEGNYFDGRYVLIEGVFNMKRRGHMGAYSGTVENVSRVVELRKWFDGPQQHTKIDKKGKILDVCK